MNEYINQHQAEFSKVKIDVEYYYRYLNILISIRCMLSKQTLTTGHLCWNYTGQVIQWLSGNY